MAKEWYLWVTPSNHDALDPWFPQQQELPQLAGDSPWRCGRTEHVGVVGFTRVMGDVIV